jgi:hypothetical protein
VITLFLESSRGIVVMIVVATALVMAARRGLSARYAVGLTAVAVLLVPLLVGFVPADAYSNSGVTHLVAHQVYGLTHPFDPSSSTFVGHLHLYGDGMRTALRYPLGLGLGANNLASVRFGGQQMATEQDVSNAAVSLGVPGLVIFLVIAVIGLSRAYRLARRTRDGCAVATLGVLVLTFGQWLNGGQYAVAWLPWLLLGWVDAQAAGRDAERIGTSESAES